MSHRYLDFMILLKQFNFSQDDGILHEFSEFELRNWEYLIGFRDYLRILIGNTTSETPV